MNKTFLEWNELFNKDILAEFTTNQYGVLWLKIKSILRKDLLPKFLIENNIQLNSSSLKARFPELFDLLSIDLTSSHNILDIFIISQSKSQIAFLDEQGLVNELYKLRNFDWGGDYKNALDKYLVDRYIKVYQNYNSLISKLDTEIQSAVTGYVLCSWYNHWSSILIENIFKGHAKVLPTVGQVKKVDFFVDGVPFDLKVTYLPTNYIEKKRKMAKFKPELTLLKQTARSLKIDFSGVANNDLYYTLIERIRDKDKPEGNVALKAIKDFRIQLAQQVKHNPRELIENLYEEQGEMRFDASNRLFLVLIDTQDFDSSWKLKRNMDELRPSIKNYLDNFSAKNIDDLIVKFNYKDKGDFTTFSDALVIIK
jgi:hypothetical protein